MGYSAAVSIPSFIGSSLSLIASSTILILHVIHPPQWHFRHALIVNLLTADLINAATNTVGGVMTFIHRQRQPNPILAGPGCTASGFLGQFSAQAIDSNILVMSITILLVVLQKNIVTTPSKTKLTVLCCTTWLPSTITSFIGLGLHLYAPVSGNWCWIAGKYLALRYALTYAWRIFIFFATTGIYAFIYIYVRKKYGVLLGLMRNAHPVSEDIPNRSIGERPESSDTSHILAVRTYSATDDVDTLPAPREASVCQSNCAPREEVTGHVQPYDLSTCAKGKLHPVQRLKTTHSSSPNARQGRMASQESQPYSDTAQRHLNLQRQLLLHGYPALYILLWTPDMINRLVESVGHPPIWLQALQATGQFMGLANAMTYGFNEQKKARIHRIRSAEHQWRAS